MGHAIMFDTLAYAKKLKKAGFSEEQAEVQAEALAELVDENLVTKRDLEELEVGLKRDLKELEVGLKRDLKEMELRLTVRLGLIQAAGIGIIGALVKLL